MVIDEADHHCARRSNSAWAKYADAFFRIIRPFELAILALQLFQALPFVRCQPGPMAGVPFGLANPAP